MSFHPIAFDNIKYLLEGHIYDLDLAGELIILDRNEWLNQAKWQKEYDITFTMGEENSTNCRFVLLSKLTNIASELLETNFNEQLSGVQFQMEYLMEDSIEPLQIEEVVQILKKNWGQHRSFEVIKTEKMYPKKTEFIFIVKFNRLIFEEQMENLEELVKVAVKTLNDLENI